MKTGSITELFKAMEAVGVVDRKIQKKLLKAYRDRDIKGIAEAIKDYFELVARRKELFQSLNQDLKHLIKTGQDGSETATCEFLVSPVLREVMGERYNPLNVRFPSRANDEPIRADYVVNGKLLIEAKRLRDEICKDGKSCAPLSFKESGQNKDRQHLSQAVYYFVQTKYENEENERIETLKHLALTNGKEWFIVENADQEISVQRVKDLQELNGKRLRGESFSITDWDSYTGLLRKLEELIGE